MTEYKNSIKEINKLYTDADKRKAARSFMLSCKESGIAYPVALDLLKASAAVNPDLCENTNLKPVSGDHAENKTKNAENRQNKPFNSELETVTDAGGLDMAEIEKKVNTALSDFMTLNNIDDMTKAPQRIWSAASRYIGLHTFKHTDILKRKYNVVNGSCMPSTCNAYDINKLAAVLNFYIYLCDVYNKAFTLDGGAAFCGTSDNYITENREKLTAAGCDPKKKAEESISRGILDGKINPTGSIAYLNNKFSWGQGAQNEQKTPNNIYIFPSLGKLSPGVVPELPQVTE